MAEYRIIQQYEYFYVQKRTFWAWKNVIHWTGTCWMEYHYYLKDAKSQLKVIELDANRAPKDSTKKVLLKKKI